MEVHHMRKLSHPGTTEARAEEAVVGVEVATDGKEGIEAHLRNSRNNNDPVHRHSNSSTNNTTMRRIKEDGMRNSIGEATTPLLQNKACAPWRSSSASCTNKSKTIGKTEATAMPILTMVAQRRPEPLRSNKGKPSHTVDGSMATRAVMMAKVLVLRRLEEAKTKEAMVVLVAVVVVAQTGWVCCPSTSTWSSLPCWQPLREAFIFT
jgi:hypothetical protein